MSFLFASIIVAVAAALAALSGYGFVLLSAPLLSHIYAPASTVLLTVTLSTVLLCLLFITTDIRRAINMPIAVRFTLWSMVGLPIGILALPHASATQFRIALAAITVVFVVSRALGWRLRLPNPQLGIAIAGILGGVFGTSTGLSALPVLWVMESLDLDPHAHRATLAGYVLATGLLTLVAFLASGMLASARAGELLSLMPALVGGLVVGSVLVKKLSERQLSRASMFYLMAIAVIAALPIGR
jgi:uncharacterized membrane protein YfcA